MYGFKGCNSFVSLLTVIDSVYDQHHSHTSSVERNSKIASKIQIWHVDFVGHRYLPYFKMTLNSHSQHNYIEFNF